MPKTREDRDYSIKHYLRDITHCFRNKISVSLAVKFLFLDSLKLNFLKMAMGFKNSHKF